MAEATLHTLIPKGRVGALIGKRGIVKRKIEEALNVKMSINSRTGSVEITQRPDAPDPTSTFNARDVVNAIGRGFSPEDAFRLLNNGVILRVIDLRDYFGKSVSDIQRIKGRIIGKKGRTRTLIENLTGVDLSVYGHTVSIIGGPIQLEAALGAVKMLIEGRLHKTVYSYLYRKRRELKEEKMKLWETPSPKPIEK